MNWRVSHRRSAVLPRGLINVGNWCYMHAVSLSEGQKLEQGGYCVLPPWDQSNQCHHQGSPVEENHVKWPGSHFRGPIRRGGGGHCAYILVTYWGVVAASSAKPPSLGSRKGEDMYVSVLHCKGNCSQLRSGFVPCSPE